MCVYDIAAMMLEYENQIFLDAFHDDGLLIMARYLPIIELAMCVCMYVSHVLDRKLLERLMSPSPKSQVMFASAFS